jgi:hypothetical protein
MALLELPEPGEHGLADPACRADEVLLLDGPDGAERGGAEPGLPPKVPPRPPGCTPSISSARPVTAESGRPPAIALAVAMRSGTTCSCSQANQWPVRPKPVWISSATNTMPLARQ